MKAKILGILGSVRFWIITLGAISAFLAFVDVNGFKFSDLFNAIAIWLGVVSGVGTIDKLGKSIGNKPQE
jgi:hypothetical protein